MVRTASRRFQMQTRYDDGEVQAAARGGALCPEWPKKPAIPLPARRSCAREELTASPGPRSVCNPGMRSARKPRAARKRLASRAPGPIRISSPQIAPMFTVMASRRCGGALTRCESVGLAGGLGQPIARRQAQYEVHGRCQRRPVPHRNVDGPNPCAGTQYRPNGLAAIT